jgi:flagellar assembly protein FliH
MSSRNPVEAPEAHEVERFRYPILPAGVAGETGESSRRQWNASVASSTGSIDSSAEEDAQSRRRAYEEGRASTRVEYEAQVAVLRQQVARSLAEFAAERQTYFDKAEEQVVRLSLAIVRKILHRESQIDPLLLSGVVRVALEKLDDSSSIRLRANPADIQKWREYFARTCEQQPAPELIGDPSLESDRCILETELGSTEIDMEMQVKEIEQGFLDLLAGRPGPR